MAVRLNPASLDWALKHVETWGDTDIFPIPFEFEAIRAFWTASALPKDAPRQRVVFRDWLSRQDLLTWTFRAPRRCLSPKHQFGFRASTQLDPLDTLLYTAVVYEIGAELEAVRVPTAKGVVFSYRFSPDADGRMHDGNINYDSFRSRSVDLAGRNFEGWVVVADIADFYPRIYSHPLENALTEATTKSEHVRFLKSMLSHLNQSVSYGIPVGPSASRLLAEVAIADVDAALMSEGLVHTRWVDDFRIFCDSERAAYSALAFLANTLFDHHGLTLQQHKTYIQPAMKFLDDNVASEAQKERLALSQKFEAIVEGLGLASYEPIDYDDLDPAVQAMIDALNLNGILEEQIGSPEPLDVPITRFILRRLAQVDDDSATELVLKSVRRLYPVFKDALAYLTGIRSLDLAGKKAIGTALLDFIDKDVVGHLDHHRAWILSTFTRDADWNNADRFVPIFNGYGDPLTRREVIFALGRAGRSEWFKGRKKSYEEFDPWQKRAFLTAVSCLPGDEAKHWYRSIAPQLDELEKAVVDWVLRNPF
jgi:hypothetical protein